MSAPAPEERLPVGMLLAYGALGFPLAALNLPGEEDALRTEFIDAIGQLDRQVLQQRLDELQRQQRDGGLTDADKQELRELLQARLQR